MTRQGDGWLPLRCHKSTPLSRGTYDASASDITSKLKNFIATTHKASNRYQHIHAVAKSQTCRDFNSHLTASSQSKIRELIRSTGVPLERQDLVTGTQARGSTNMPTDTKVIHKKRGIIVRRVIAPKIGNFVFHSETEADLAHIFVRIVYLL